MNFMVELLESTIFEFRLENTVAQHITQSKAYRDFPLAVIQNLTEDAAWQMLVLLRWASPTIIGCPWCGAVDQHYLRRTRKQWRCKHCSGVFGVMTDTPFVGIRIAFKQLLQLIYFFVAAPKGLAANQILAVMAVTFRTAYQNLGKIREAIFQTQDLTPLTGVVQIDGGHFCGKPRRPRHRTKMTSAIANNILRNRKASIVPPKRGVSIEPWNRKKLENRRIVLVLRQLSSSRGEGATRTIVAIIPAEERKHVFPVIEKYVSKQAVIQTDSGNAFAGLADKWADHETVTHSVEYCTSDGVNNNQAESFFSRLRRSEYSIHHGMRPQYLAFFAAEMAWREDVRKWSMKEKFMDLVNRIFRCGPSKAWRGYAQGNRLGFEYLS